MNDFLVCLVCALLIPTLAVLKVWFGRKKYGQHKEFIDSPYNHPIENYSMSKPRR